MLYTYKHTHNEKRRARKKEEKIIYTYKHTYIKNRSAGGIGEKTEEKRSFAGKKQKKVTNSLEKTA